MRLSIPISLSLLAFISPAVAVDGQTKVTITGDHKANIYTPTASTCLDTHDAEEKVTKITIQAASDVPECTFYTDKGCAGQKWTIKIPTDSADRTKTQKFSRPFYVASLQCSQS